MRTNKRINQEAHLWPEKRLRPRMGHFESDAFLVLWKEGANKTWINRVYSMLLLVFVKKLFMNKSMLSHSSSSIMSLAKKKKEAKKRKASLPQALIW